MTKFLFSLALSFATLLPSWAEGEPPPPAPAPARTEQLSLLHSSTHIPRQRFFIACEDAERAQELAAALPEAYFLIRGVGHESCIAAQLRPATHAEALGHWGELQLYALDAAAPSDRLPMVLIPAHGVTITLDPTLPEGGSLIELKSTLPEATARWHCDTLSLWQEGGRWWARLSPGTHRLQVDDPVNHLSAHATFIVEDAEAP